MNWKRLTVVSLCAALFFATGAAAQTGEPRSDAAMDHAKRLYRNRDFRGAASELETVLESGGPRADALYLLGYSHLMLRDYTEAVDDFARAFEADPTFDPRTIYQRPAPETE
jgi:tetratricopeptide (TPR) repeat protein